MEYVPGDALDQLLQTHPDRVHDHLREILVRLADAIAYAHRNHVIHRDLKPGNILLSPLQEVKILDFGIAARLDTAHDSSSPTVCGTPYYMAPEQITGREVDHRADLYSLGAVMYELLTGFRPFRADNLSKLLHQIVYATPPPIHTYRDDLPEELLLALVVAVDDAHDQWLYAHWSDLSTTDLEQAAVRSSDNLRRLLTPTYEAPPSLPA